MKKATKPATSKETKTKPKAKTAVKTAVKPKAELKKKSSGDAKVKKVAKVKDVLPPVAKPKTKAGIKPKTKAETETGSKVRIKTETKSSAKTKPAIKKKVTAMVAPQKITAAAKTKAKVEKKPLKVAAPKKATPITVLKSAEKKVASPAKKTAVVQKKKPAPAKKAAPAAAAKRKAVAVAPKKVPAKPLALAQKKTALKAAVPSKKPEETLMKAPVKSLNKSISKTKMVTAESAKLPLKKTMPVQAPPRIKKTEPGVKTLSGDKSGLKPATKPAVRKPEEKPSAKKETGSVAKASTKKVMFTEVNKQPAREHEAQTTSPLAKPLKTTRIVRPAVPAVAEEAGEELLSVAEIEAREGRVIKPRLKIFLPREENIRERIEDKEDKPVTGREALPAEYGESEFFMIVIDPILVFLDWEIMPEDLPAEGLPLCVRIYDVTGMTFDGTNAHGFIDIDLEGLTGSGYCEIGMQGREIVAEIGFIDAHGVFIALMRSAKASVPSLLQYDELGIVLKMQEAGLPVGY